jgi:hypothetical protein
MLNAMWMLRWVRMAVILPESRSQEVFQGQGCKMMVNELKVLGENA